MLCGKRGANTFSTVTRTTYEQGFKCPEGMKACSTQPIANSPTYCVTNGNNYLDDCPVTDL